MKKHAIIDVKNIYYSKISIDEDNVLTYGQPNLLYESEQIDLSVTTSTLKKHTTGGIDVINDFEGGEATIKTYGIDNATLAEIEGHEIDSNGVVIEKSDDEPPHVAIGFQAIKRNNASRFVWLLYCKKKYNSESYVKKTEKTDPISSTLTFDVSERIDKQWKNIIDSDDTNAPEDLENKWFKNVYDGSAWT